MYYQKPELSALDQNVQLDALKLEGKNGKSVEAFPVLDIANEPDAVLIANIISLKYTIYMEHDWLNNIV